MQYLPQHLQKYIVDQDYNKYTAQDHAVWRYILRQLKSFLTTHAHQSYLQGLEKTGIKIDYIPKISDISQHLENFGWRALPVSGFIPPAAFMELQSLGVLPIASDMRSIDHLLYTPAPDIVHEAAGHAPFIADAEYAEYLKQYAQVAKMAIISKEDYNLYAAIRELSDIKENPQSNSTQVKQAEENLTKISNSISYVSEASELSRMNWWTAEYGLVGDINHPKIFGAGLLSSVGESQWCLSDKVKKIPLSLNCIQQSYDITEPQPQLFVAENFKHLSKVLQELSETMAYKTGGTQALDKAQKAESVNTVVFENTLQISGVLKNYLTDQNSQPIYLQFSGPTQLSYQAREISGHGKTYHSEGYGTPVGPIKNFNLADLKLNQKVNLQYSSGVSISGQLTQILKLSEQAIILSFDEATCQYNNQVLFAPEWGTYDIILAQKVVSVFGGPADRLAYGEIDDFIASRVSAPQYSEKQQAIFKSYQKTRALRNAKNSTNEEILNLFNEFKVTAPTEWLLYLELIELALANKNETQLVQSLESYLQLLGRNNSNVQAQIQAGLKLANEMPL